ncbi:complement C4-B [Cheilinus undulatus]|uniref:complement C4-B n=1 Tax=Cheilinus undulatus TaxID=241271 RepID=UPI001BD44204|nr:complement C4-B [Cheilinus undulatus]
MECYIFSILFLVFAWHSECSSDNRFFISAPGVFHWGVNNKVFVQRGGAYLNSPVTLYLENQANRIVSEKKTIYSTEAGGISTVELMIDKNFQPEPGRIPYLNLIAESPSFGVGVRKATRVLFTHHRGYIFIQTHQPIYNPKQTVMYRVFTLDQKLRPHHEVFHLSVFNAAGNRVMHILLTAKGGIYQGKFHIPEVSKLGTWTIRAHYKGDKDHAAKLEFKVQKFVLPNFEVNIGLEKSYILLNAEQLNFTISAKYSHGERVRGAYHCKFGVVDKNKEDDQKKMPIFLRGLELTGSVQNVTEPTLATLQMADLQVQLQKLNLTLSELQQRGSQIYLGVFVTNIQSGEVQEDEVYLPIISHKYTMDLSQTRLHFLPGYPLDVVVVMHHPDGSPAVGVPVQVHVSSSIEPWEGTTNQEGAVFPSFNTNDAPQITLQVSAGDLQQTKVIQRATSPSGSYIYLSFTHQTYSVGDVMSVTYYTINGPNNGRIYYMVLSRGSLIQTGSFGFGTNLKHNLLITSEMVPSFRLIGYFYDQGGKVIADSVWVDVRDECEIKVEVKHSGQYAPRQLAQVEFDLHGQNAKVALLAVDKAFYALKADNKLTAKQVFSTMQSYDRGCSKKGGANPASVLLHAGLSFVTHSESEWIRGFSCDPESTRQRRAVDLQQEILTLKSNFTDEKLKDCCVRGFSLIPMRQTCQERARRVSLVEVNPSCAEAFLNCCLEGERLRQKKKQEDSWKEFGRTVRMEDIERYFLDNPARNIRRLFPPSFEFREFEVNGKKRHVIALPDSITTWEIQVITLSPATGFCVAKPSEIRAFKKVFVSLRLPYSVRKYEQLSISPVIYNYGQETLQLAVNMEQTEGLCSPASATSASFVNITLKPESSQFVSFSAIPMATGSIPIKIRVVDMVNEQDVDAIEKTLNVLTEGIEKREEQTKLIKFDGGKSSDTLIIDGTFPDETVPESGSNIFVSVEGEGFGSSHAKNLLSPEKVKKLLNKPGGCLQQTMSGFAPTVTALRYLDKSDQWFNLPIEARDEALGYVEHGHARIVRFKNKNDGSYSSFRGVPRSNWVTALVVKMLSLIAQLQADTIGEQGRRAKTVPLEEIRHPVSYLLSAQEDDGSFIDPHQVLHSGLLTGTDQRASMTAFVTLALQRSLEFLHPEGKRSMEASLSRSTTYLKSRYEELQHPYAVAITAYCLAVCLPPETDRSFIWGKLEELAVEGENGCYLWTKNPTPSNKAYADAITIENTAYALLAAVELQETEWANKAACWLTTQENSHGGFRSTQDTIMALEALAEYELERPPPSEASLRVVFTTQVKSDILKLELENKEDKVEKDLRRLAGHTINAVLTGKGSTKLKVVKAYHLLEPKDECKDVSIRVTVEGKVEYTAKVVENYDYYEDYNGAPEVQVPGITEGSDVWDTNNLDTNSNSNEALKYTVCVSHSLNRNLTGMAIADITLLSGFEAVTDDLDVLKEQPEQYISHYEVTYGRVILYFNKLFDNEECISFNAIQSVPIGLLQPAEAVFYDYYEPDVKCAVFYSAPQRSKLISRLCSEDVCQCAERPCHKIHNTFKSERSRRGKKENQRLQHACFFPTVDYAYMVEVLNISMKSNFELYRMNILDVLKSHGDMDVGENSIRVFAKRRHCKEELDLGKQYLIMGKDGSTTDSNKKMQYLLESNTWVEKKPSEEECKKSAYRAACREFLSFTNDYKINGCRQ